MKPIKVKAFLKYNRTAASSRIRFLQYREKFEENGYAVETAELFDTNYIEERYSGKRQWLKILKQYTKQFKECLRTRLDNYDIIWIEREILPLLPQWFEGSLLKPKARLVIDIDDADYERYKRSWLCRAIPTCSKKIDHWLTKSHLVFAGNQAIFKHSRTLGQQNTKLLPTVIDTKRYSKPCKPRIKNCLGWIGTPLNSKYLLNISDAIHEISAAQNLKFHCIGGDPKILKDLPIILKNWSEESEVDELAKLDIGLMPLPNSPFERGKCGYKLIQYMASGIPVIASPVGENVNIVKNGLNGYLARTTQDWIQYIKIIYANKEIYNNMCHAARKTVEDHYSIETAWPIIDNALKEL